MPKLSEFIAEIQSDLSSFADEIDKVTIKRHIIYLLRTMGVDICNIEETVLLIENSTAQLPDNFKSARMVLKTNVVGDDVAAKDEIKDSYTYRQRVENPAYYDHINQQYVSTCTSKIITEKILINNKTVSLYHQPEWLSVEKGTQGNFATNCLNLNPAINNKYKNKVSINRNTLNTNFSKGTVYLQYYALPTDEDGEIYIPEMTTGDFTIYCESYVKEKIMWDLIANNKNPQALLQLYAPLKQELKTLKTSAIVECRFWGLSNGWQTRLKEKSQRIMSSFDLPRI